MIVWCSFCNSKPAEGDLSLYSRTHNEIMPYPACKDCVAKIRDGKVDWIENGLE